MNDSASKKGKPESKLKGYNNVFAVRLRKKMDDLHITQQTLAEKTGCSRQAISQYMDGTSIPNVDKLLSIAEYFGVSTDHLLGREDKTNENEYIHQVCDLSGLPIKFIYGMSKYSVMYPKRTEILNSILQSSNFPRILWYIEQYQRHFSEEVEESEKAYNELLAKYQDYQSGKISEIPFIEYFIEDRRPTTINKSNGDLYAIQEQMISLVKELSAEDQKKYEAIENKEHEIQEVIEELSENAYFIPEENDPSEDIILNFPIKENKPTAKKEEGVQNGNNQKTQ